METVCVVGAGTMGSGIAYAAAVAGFKVNLHDHSAERLKKTEEWMATNIRKRIKTNPPGCGEEKNAVGTISYTDHLAEACSHVDIVIEAVFEKLALKIDIFKQLDHLCRDQTMLATNTSTMSPTEIAAQTSRPDKCIAMHFLNPVHKMNLVEVIKGLETSDETVRRAKKFVRNLGKEPVEVNEFPGFVTSRMSCLMGNEAMNMLMEGVATAEDIDKAIVLGLNHPMGPLQLADLVGLDTRLRNMEYLYQTLGERFRPSLLLRKYVAAGRLGRKTGAGFYEYP